MAGSRLSDGRVRLGTTMREALDPHADTMITRGDQRAGGVRPRRQSRMANGMMKLQSSMV